MTTLSKASDLRILVLAPTASQDAVQHPPPFPSFLERLTGVAPSRDITSFAGYTTHDPLPLKTKYYEKNVSIWCDELPQHTDSIAQHKDILPNDKQSRSTNETRSAWENQMTSATAREVRDVIGAIIVILPYNSNSLTENSLKSADPGISQWIPYIESGSKLRDLIEDETAREVASLVVLQDFQQLDGMDDEQSSLNSLLLEKLEDECLSTHGILGWDFVSVQQNDSSTPYDEQSRNEYGEKLGISRIVEVLEGVDWSAYPNDGLDDDDSFDAHGMDMSFLDDINLSSLSHHAFPGGVSQEKNLQEDHELQREMMELKMSMLNMDEEHDKNNADDDFGALASAELPEQRSNGQDEDVWASLDNKEEEALQVDQLQGLMDRVISIREAGSEMSLSEREKFAKREISRLMKEL